MRRFLASLTLVILASPAFACLNDTELPNHEREFRSQYKRSTPPPQTDSPYRGNSTLGLSMLFGSGTLLLVGAIGVARTTRRPRK